MENKINIAELLKDCPKGMELDCTMYNKVTLSSINDGENISFPINAILEDGSSISFTKYGQFINENFAKCVIFPKGKTTWEGFHRSFKDGDIVATTTGNWIGITAGGERNCFISTYCVIKSNGKFEAYFDKKERWEFNRLATEEEKQKLFDAIKDNGYKWNAETKTLEKLPKFKVGDRVKHISAYASGIVVKVTDKGYYIDYSKGSGIVYISFTVEKDYELAPNKFDINTLIPFESRILVRNNKDELWQPAIFGFINKDNFCVYTMNHNLFYCCIPYEDNKHLIGTNKDCDNFYKTWKS